MGYTDKLNAMYEAPIEPRNVKGGGGWTEVGTSGSNSSRRGVLPPQKKAKNTKQNKTIGRTNKLPQDIYYAATAPQTTREKKQRPVSLQ